MSFVIAAPEYVTAAASDLAGLGSTIRAANAAAFGPTSNVLAAAADEVSEGIAGLFGAHGQAYQALSAQLESFHQEFVGLLSGGAAQYAGAEAAGANPLQALEQQFLDVVNGPQPAADGTPTSWQRRQRRTGHRGKRRRRRMAVRQRRSGRVRRRRAGRGKRGSRRTLRRCGRSRRHRRNRRFGRGQRRRRRPVRRRRRSRGNRRPKRHDRRSRRHRRCRWSVRRGRHRRHRRIRQHQRRHRWPGWNRRSVCQRRSRRQRRLRKLHRRRDGG